MTDWAEEYAETDDLNEKYGLLRAEITRLRGRRDDVEFFDTDAVRSDVRRLSDAVAGDLIVFVANDFGLPVAYRPRDVSKDAQNEIRQAILQDKYDETNEDLNKIRRELLDEHLGIHKAIVAESTEETVRYHLPEGSNETTNFITVREMVGLIDYTTNSFQSDGLTETY
ncbi:hypothetical protein [Halorussus halophilus]|uniref:hypothetical protein n=1 Tax=Halorussus halophilus TaxID=2650975 RepID=UPI001300E911|nr:hypothetical protein [Halorussus halophilus]